MRKGILVVLAAGLLVPAGMTAWLLGTSSGAQWLVRTISSRTPFTVQAGSIEGYLAGDLRMKGLRISWPEGNVRIGEFLLQWRPHMLLAGVLDIRELSATSVQIQDNRPQGPGSQTFTWPQAGRKFLFMNVRADIIRLENFSYQRRNTAPFLLNNFSSLLFIRAGKVITRNMKLSLPQLRLEGGMALGLRAPSLKVNLVLFPVEPLAAMDQVKVDADLRPAKAPAFLEGSLKLAGSSSGTRLIELSTRLAAGPHSIGVRDLAMHRPGRRGVLSGAVQILLSGKTPAIQADLKAENLDLSPELPDLTNLNGTLNIEGTRDDYQGAILLSQAGIGWRAARLGARFKGNAGQAELTSLEGSWLEGTIEGSGRAAWGKNISFETVLRTKNMDPVGIAPQLTGSVNLDLSGKALWQDSSFRQGTLSFKLLESNLRGKNLNGDAKIQIRNNNLIVERFVFKGEGLSINARGDLADRLALSARMDAGPLLGEAMRGDFSIEGWVRRRDGLFSGGIAGSGKQIAAGEINAAVLEFSARFDAKDKSFDLDATARDMNYQVMHADSLELRASGLPSNHSIQVAARSSSYRFRIGFEGAYDREAWNGRIIQLSGNDTVGAWEAGVPVSLSIFKNGFSLSPLTLTGATGERFSMQGRLIQNPFSGSMHAEWQEINLARVNAWLGRAKDSGSRSGPLALTGSLSGRVAGTITSRDKLDFDGTMTISRAKLRHRVRDLELAADIDSAKLAWGWHDEFLRGEFSLALAQYGNLNGHLQVPLRARLPISFDRTGLLRVEAKGKLQETGILSALFPGLVQESHGQLALDLGASGTWEAPRLNGSLRLEKAGAYFPAAGIRLSDVLIEAHLDENRIRIETVRARSGPGSIQGKAIVNLRQWQIVNFEGSLEGERFQVFYLPEMRSLCSPRIEFKGTTEHVYARGEIRVPEFLVYGPPKEGPIEPSEDIVIVGGRTETAESAGPSLDIEIRLILGDRVLVKTEGIDAQLNGEVTIFLRSVRDIRGSGEIRVTKGRYSAYGVSLEITRGRILFSGEQLENPTLDVLAVRTIGEIRAGVLVSGTVKKPVVRLTSEPAMADTDILAYMVLGHPLGGDKNQESYVMQAAGALLSAGQSVVLQDQMKQRLGLDTIDVQAGSGDISRSLVTVGKYLTPRVYLSYGRSLFTGDNLFRIRYTLSKRWEIETYSGATSGADLYFKISFD